MQDDSDNPNEVILIPLLNKKAADLFGQNTLLEAKLMWAEKQAKEAAERQSSELQSAHEQIKLLTERSAAVERLECELRSLRETVEAEKRTIVENWQREIATQTGTLRTQIESLSQELQAAKAYAESLSVTQTAPVKIKGKGKKEPTVIGGDTY